MILWPFHHRMESLESRYSLQREVIGRVLYFIAAKSTLFFFLTR